MNQRRHFMASALTAAAMLCAGSSFAQSTTRIIVPFAPGGPVDVTARILAEAVKDSLGTVIVENKPGAGGNIGVSAAAKSAPDGLTLGIATTASHSINPWLFSQLPYSPANDFVPVTQMLRVPNVLVINAESAQRNNINSLADLIKFAKANPAKLAAAEQAETAAQAATAAQATWRANCSSTRQPFTRFTFPTTVGTRPSWACCPARWTSTLTTSPRHRPTSVPASSRPWR